MKRKGRFLVVLAVAALTFGALWATLGPEKFNQHRCGACHQMEQCCNAEKSNQQITPATPADSLK